MKLQRGLKFQETGVARARSRVGFSLSLEPRFLLNFPFSLFPSLPQQVRLLRLAFGGAFSAFPGTRMLPFEIGLGK